LITTNPIRITPNKTGLHFTCCPENAEPGIEESNRRKGPAKKSFLERRLAAAVAGSHCNPRSHSRCRQTRRGSAALQIGESLWHTVCFTPRPKKLVGSRGRNREEGIPGPASQEAMLSAKVLDIEKVAKFLDREETFVAERHGGDGPERGKKERERGIDGPRF